MTGKNMDVHAPDGFPIDLVEANEIMSLVLKCIGTPEYQKAVNERDASFREGAMWGAAFTSMYANTHAAHYGARVVDSVPPSQAADLLLYYPCDYCGSCSAWLAAYKVGALETHEELIAECKRRGCNLVGTPVPKEVTRYA